MVVVETHLKVEGFGCYYITTLCLSGEGCSYGKTVWIDRPRHVAFSDIFFSSDMISKETWTAECSKCLANEISEKETQIN